MSPDWKKWLDTPEAGTTAVDLAFLALEESFVARDLSQRRIIVRYFQHDVDRSLLGKVVFGPGAQGPPDFAHGGAMAALLDDAMGGACWLSGFPVLAVNLNITFRQMLPLETPCLVETRVTRVEGRKISTEGRILAQDRKTVFSEGEALFVVLEEKQLARFSPKIQAIITRLNQG
jgi:acyl-coenzyme A thioesterase PaaI-like protein|nr:PaaI family thioesterase [Candidatus Krumholzibacteria bacterium]